MIKRLLLAALFSIAAVPAFAACSNPVTVKDSSGSNVSMSVATGADTNCQSKIDWDTSSQAHADTTAPIAAGTNNIGKVTPNDGANSIVYDPCQSAAATYKSFSITTATTTNIVTGTAAKKLYVCYLYMQTAAPNNVAVISGTTGATCGSNTAALIGGTTAANGLNNAANGGQAIGTGASAVLQVATNNDDICIITSAATPLAGAIKYVVQ